MKDFFSSLHFLATEGTGRAQLASHGAAIHTQEETLPSPLRHWKWPHSHAQRFPMLISEALYNPV